MRPLQRPANSAAEIEALPPLESTEGSAHVRQHGQSYAPETLVYLMREAIKLRNTMLFEMGYKFLIGEPRGGRWEGGHCERTIASLARAYGFYTNRDLRLGFRSRCLVSLSEAIYAGRAAKPYWEERFGDAFKKACIDAARSLSLPRNRDMEAGVTRDSDDVIDVDDLDPEIPLIDAEVAERLSKPHHEAAVLQAVRALPHRQGQAVMLWLEGHPIEGPADDTVAKIMNISPRAVYKHLRNALPTLRALADIRAIWFGDA
jgi:DNA-binding CsgD family transcriptional regulator